MNFLVNLNVCIITPHGTLPHVDGVGPLAPSLGHHQSWRRDRWSNLQLDLLDSLSLVQTTRESRRDGGIRVWFCVWDGILFLELYKILSVIMFEQIEKSNSAQVIGK